MTSEAHEPNARPDWDLLFEHFDKLNASKDQKKELEEEILWTEKHLKDLKEELKKLQEAISAN